MSEQDSNKRYCTACGAEVAPGATFCPSCGASVAAQEQAANAPAANPNAGKSDSLTTIGVLIALWAAFSILVGVWFIASADAILDLVHQAGVTYMDYTKDAIVLSGAIVLAGGVTAAISAACCFMRKLYPVALAMCIISAILAFSGILTLIIGLVMAYFIYKNKWAFHA